MARGRAATAALISLLFVLLHVYFRTYASALEFNPDEGANLMKALLTREGFALYRDIWSDQPPLFTDMLRGFMGIFGWQVETARLLVLVCAAALLFFVFLMVADSYGSGIAALAVLFFALSLNFFWLSVSVMIGLPSVTFAAAAVWVLFEWRKEPERFRLLLSGALFGCALGVKLFVMPLVLCIVALLCVKDIKRSFGCAAWWGFGCTAMLGVVCGGVDFGRMIEQFGTHIDLARSRPEIYQSSAESLRSYALVSVALIMPAAIGLAVSFFKGSLLAAIAGLWFSVMTVTFYFHFPVWTHQLILLSVPLSIFAAIGVGRLIETALRRGSGKVAATKRIVAGAVAAALVGFYAKEGVEKISAGPAVSIRALVIPYSEETAELLDNIKTYSRENKFVMTDRPVLAFYHGLTTPPWLAVVSLKRSASGKLSPELILSEIRKYKVGQIVLSKRVPASLEARFAEILADEYTLIGRFNGITQLVRNDLID